MGQVAQAQQRERIPGDRHRLVAEHPAAAAGTEGAVEQPLDADQPAAQLGNGDVAHPPLQPIVCQLRQVLLLDHVDLAPLAVQVVAHAQLELVDVDVLLVLGQCPAPPVGQRLGHPLGVGAGIAGDPQDLLFAQSDHPVKWHTSLLASDFDRKSGGPSGSARPAATRDL